MLKSIVAALIITLTVINLTSCGQDYNQPDNAVTASVSEVPGETSAITAGTKISSVNKEALITSDSALSIPVSETVIFPILDGSTSTIPLEAGIRAAYSGIPPDEAEGQVNRNKTHLAYENLLRGECDGLLSVPLSAEQEQMRIDAGIELEMIPLALEGFVFIVNKDNPVDTLTSEQIRKIYSGEITNWKEAGGNDAEIKAYQRNQDSGSQNFMTWFMGDVSLMNAPADYIAEAMGGMVDTVANYENGINSIGYSVYTYAADMYSADNGIKFINIDGVPPNRENFKNGSYPAVGYTYLMFSKNQPEDSPVRKLAGYLQTPEGMKVIEDSGYAAVDKPHLGLPDMKLDLLSSSLLGTGIRKPEDYSFPTIEYTVINEKNPRLKDKNTEKLINDDVRNFYPGISDDGIWSNINVKNGYMTVNDLTYDLYTGKRLELTDFFFEDTAFVPMLNQDFKKGLQSEFYRGDGGGMFANSEPDFWGIDNKTTVTLNGVVFEKDSYYSINIGNKYYKTTAYSGKPFINLNFSPDIFIPSVPRDMKGIWEDENDVTENALIYKAENYSVKNGILYGLFTENCPLSDEIIKKANDYILTLTIPENLEKFKTEYSENGAWGNTAKAYCYGDSYICVHTEKGSGPSADRYFDAKTFEDYKFNTDTNPVQDWKLIN